ncbi:MAG: hypothetical protein FWD99_07610 [Oscillospiraceae bacterium]|nr:hypothetical protein [Oscillospiraceae bacterium]
MSNHKIRCQNSVAISPCDDAAFLRAGIDRGAANIRLYCMLMQCCGGCEVTCALTRLVRAERRQVCELKAAFFILTGQTHRPSPTCPYICTCLDTLRQLCLEESEVSICFLDHAARTKCLRTANLCNRIGAEKACTAEELETLIATLLC